MVDERKLEVSFVRSGTAASCTPEVLEHRPESTVCASAHLGNKASGLRSEPHKETAGYM